MITKRFLLVAYLCVLSIPLLAQRDTITILHVNDTHSNLAPAGPRDAQLKGTRGGVARLATLVGMTKMADPNALLLHGGDSFIGDLTFNATYGAAELTLLNALGFDAMVAGNHEFDLTPVALLMALDTVKPKFQILSANAVLTDPKVQPLTKYIKPSMMKTVKGHKIGIIGVTTPETNLLSLPAPVFIDTLVPQAVGAALASLKTQGCEAIILMSHCGIAIDSLIVKNVPGIDLVLSAHDHHMLTAPRFVRNPLGKSVPLVEAAAFQQGAGKVRLVLEGGSASLLDYRHIALDASIPEEPTTKAMVAQLCTTIEQLYKFPFFTQQVGVATASFRDDADSLLLPGKRDTPVGNLVTDAFRAAMKTDIALQACGSTSQSLPSGAIVPADLFRMIGYGFNKINGLGFRVATFKMTGMELLKGLEIGLSMIDKSDEFFIQVSGMKYGYDPTQPPFKRIRPELIRIGNQPIDVAKNYTVTANEFALAIISKFGVAVTDVALRDSLTEFQVVLGYVAQVQTITPAVEGRILAEARPNMVEQRYGSLRPAVPAVEHYPNPVRSQAEFRFTLSTQSHVTIDVYDAVGRRVKELTCGEYGPGTHTLNISQLHLQPGVYLYSLAADGKRAIQKMIVQ